VTFLPPEAADLGDCHAVHACRYERLLNVFKFEMPNNRFDFLHRWSAPFEYEL
jgi:hypothetical protein